MSKLQNNILSLAAKKMLSEQASLVNLKPLKEGSMQARELADEYRGKKDGLQKLKDKLEDKFAEMANDPNVEPEGGPKADEWADTLHTYEEAIRLLSPKQKSMTYDQSIAKGDIEKGQIRNIVLIGGAKTEVIIKNNTRTLTGRLSLTNIEITFNGVKHVLDFKEEDVIADHGTEGKDVVFIAMSKDEQFIFMLDAEVEEFETDPNYIRNINFDSLEIDKVKDLTEENELDEGTCGYTQTADGKKLKTPGGTKGTTGLNRTNFMRGASTNTY